MNDVAQPEGTLGAAIVEGFVSKISLGLITAYDDDFACNEVRSRKV